MNRLTPWLNKYDATLGWVAAAAAWFVVASHAHWFLAFGIAALSLLNAIASLMRWRR